MCVNYKILLFESNTSAVRLKTKKKIDFLKLYNFCSGL